MFFNSLRVANQIYHTRNALILRNVHHKHPQGSIGKVRIGDSEKYVKAAENPELIPRKTFKISSSGEISLTQSALQHLRWIIQKDVLDQDVLFVGSPGALRRNIAMQYAQLTQREIEFISLNRDTTESDLKQRREILNGSAIYYDQCAVRAAVKGRVLIIEGVEKTERNVLPILNNLLENREMHLEDGRFLIAANKYDKLLKRFSEEQMKSWGLVRVSENFRVIGLCLPVPKYRGSPLDPPLRSRFQARNITSLTYHESLAQLLEYAPNTNVEKLEKVLSFAYGVGQSDAASSLPDFPLDNLKYAAAILEQNPYSSIYDIISRFYPYKVFLEKGNHTPVSTLLHSLSIQVDHPHQKLLESGDGQAKIQLGHKKIIDIPIPMSDGQYEAVNKFVETNYQDNVLASVLQSFSVGDICLIGPKGCGKSAITTELCRVTNQIFEPLVLYQDMTARDLIQKRTTLENGNTIWRDSPLIRAAQKGHVAVLDGIHRLHFSTLSILHRLLHDRELQLYDGRRLINHEKYDELIENGQTKLELNEKGIIRIHPSFRVIALAEPPTKNAANWITSETLSLFMYHEIRDLSKEEEIKIITQLYGKVPTSLEKIINLAFHLRQSNDPIMKNLSGNLSTRQLLRIAKRMSKYHDLYNTDNSYDIVQRTFLAKFLPNLPKTVLENSLQYCHIFPVKDTALRIPKDFVQIKDKMLKIGNTTVPVYETDAITKIPDILFYDVPQHLVLLEHLLQDFLLGDHLLLVGNQGVGKNKIADRFLQLMNRPREYIQLHRDSTVQSLTVQTHVKEGIVVHEDSPLVKAVKNGHILVVDEADKAPVHVTCILKTLVENGEMILSDGRKIMPINSPREEIDNEEIIYTHPDFRMIVLANRPGFPFLGNDFFASLGDLFSCHAVDNPSPESEIFLLKQYGPNIPDKIIRQLVSAFSELRSMADSGLLSYPYSTREVIAIVKHLQKYPEEDMSELVGNVLDYDRYTPEILEQVTGVLQKHGLKIGSYAKNELAILRRQKQLQLTVESFSGKDVSMPKHGKVDPNNDPHVGGNTWAGGSGGRDTAGLGGKGGPYRLDSGHKVHQLSDQEKDDIPEHVKKAAREMNRKAFDDKLKEIKMSRYDHNVYQQFSGPVQKQVQLLRIVLNSLQAKSKERQWMKHQTSGELDDTKLIEGLTGEKSIYKRRLEQEPEPGQPQEKPKRLKLVVDVSGSMYRFNGYDGRLDRQLEAVVMVMEAFDGFESKVKYDIVGHSGEATCIPFVDEKNPPKDDKRRLETIKMMHAHSQFCWSGDHTVMATKMATEDLAKEDCDEAIVVVLSDANLARYGISPNVLNNALIRQEPKVKAFVIFIGSLGEEADFINKHMSAGRSFVCMDLEQLPNILKQIFTSSMLQ